MNFDDVEEVVDSGISAEIMGEGGRHDQHAKLVQIMSSELKI